MYELVVNRIDLIQFGFFRFSQHFDSVSYRIDFNFSIESHLHVYEHRRMSIEFRTPMANPST